MDGKAPLVVKISREMNGRIVWKLLLYLDIGSIYVWMAESTTDGIRHRFAMVHMVLS